MHSVPCGWSATMLPNGTSILLKSGSWDFQPAVTSLPHWVPILIMAINQLSDSVEKESCRPDFMILMYPVISFTDTSMHLGSREALLGKEADPALVSYYSNELQVKDDTPPAFFVHADNDNGVPVENTLLMYKALRARHIPAELHILSEGDHGFGLGGNNEHIASWKNNLKLWLGSLNK